MVSVVITAASQEEGFGFESTVPLDLFVWSSHSCHVREINRVLKVQRTKRRLNVVKCSLQRFSAVKLP